MLFKAYERLAKMTEQRLIELEIKISYQEVAIEALHRQVYDQIKKIDQLENRLQKLAARFDEETEPASDIGPSNEKPPHY